MKSLTDSITDFYIKNNIINPDMREIYAFGIDLIINDIIIFSSILIAAAVIGSFWHGVIFSTVFYLTRIRCGGFHAKRAWVCKLSMLATFGSVMMLFFIFTRFNMVGIAVFMNIISVFIAAPIVPVENPNKRLTADARQKNKKQGLIIVFLFTALAALLTAAGIQEGVIISLTVTAVAVLAAVGKIINETEGKNNEQLEKQSIVDDC